MPESIHFWEFFNQQVSSKLGIRTNTFRQIFKFLDRIDGRLNIIETGCARQKDNWQGDGQSTLLFDKYVSLRSLPSKLYSVDINQKSIDYARSLVGSKATLTKEDSVKYLNQLTREFEKTNDTVDLLYLDSFDLDTTYWYPSAAHHLKELCAAMRILRKDSLVVVDDCPLTAHFVPGLQNQINLITPPMVGGKGRLVAEYAAAIGATLVFSEYQAGWTNF